MNDTFRFRLKTEEMKDKEATAVIQVRYESNKSFGNHFNDCSYRYVNHHDSKTGANVILEVWAYPHK